MDLEDELNRLFKDERLDVRVAPDAEKHVVAGAKRVRRNRLAMISAAGVLSAAVLAGGVFVLAQPGPQQNQTAQQPSDLPIENPSANASQAPPSSATTESPTTSNAPPSTSVPTGPTPATSRPAAPPPMATTSPVVPGALLGPTGFGSMRLGMTEEQLFATGQVQGSPKPNSGCATYSTRTAGGTVYLSKDNGVAAFVFRSGVVTPERIGIGSTQEAVKAAYPDFTGTTARVPTNSSAKYRFDITSGKVSGISLLANQQDCVS